MVSSDYLKPTYFIDSESEIIKELANELSEGYQQNKEIAREVFHYVRDTIKYSIKEITLEQDKFKASSTIQAKKGFCISKSITVVALMRANGIPARLHFADIINHRSPKYLQELMGTNIFYFHGYLEVYLENKWIKLTPSFETSLCERHNFPLCEFNPDTMDDAIFKPKDNLGRPFVEYINDRGVYTDLPFQEMAEAFISYYGETYE